MLNVMIDEFEVNVEDESGAEMASKILGLRKLIRRGDFGMVDEMYRRWVDRQRKGEERVEMKVVEGDKDESEDSEELEDDGDVDMGEAPELVKAPKEKVAPKVDEDGFTEVVGKKKR